MSVFKRIKTIFNSVVNDSLDKIENPILVAKETIRELDKEISDAKSSLFALQGNLKLDAERISVLDQRIEKRNKQLQELVTVEDQKELVLEIETDLNAIVAERDGLKGQYENLSDTVKILQEQIERSHQMRNQVNLRLSKLVAQQNASNALGKASDVAIKLNAQSTESEFVRIEQKVSQGYAESLAKADYVRQEMAKTTSIDDKFENAVQAKKLG